MESGVGTLLCKCNSFSYSYSYTYRYRYGCSCRYNYSYAHRHQYNCRETKEFRRGTGDDVPQKIRRHCRLVRFPFLLVPYFYLWATNTLNSMSYSPLMDCRYAAGIIMYQMLFGQYVFLALSLFYLYISPAASHLIVSPLTLWRRVPFKATTREEIFREKRQPIQIPNTRELSPDCRDLLESLIEVYRVVISTSRILSSSSFATSSCVWTCSTAGSAV